MKWILLVMLLQGGVAYIPMETHEACVVAAYKIQQSNSAARTSCISQGE